MPSHHGTEGQVFSGANQVAEVNGFEFTETAEFAEDTELSDTGKSRNAQGITDRSGTLDCWWDETDTLGQETLLIGASVTLNLRPEGSTTGDIEHSGTAYITEIAIATPKGDMSTRRFSWIQGADDWTIAAQA